MTTVNVFVRLGENEDETKRQVTFPLSGIPVRELIEKGIAVDGNQAGFTIRPVYLNRSTLEGYTGAFITDGPGQVNSEVQSMDEALLIAEKGLIEFLETKGFSVELS